MIQKQTFKETEIGMIPEGWSEIRLSDLIEIIGGGTPKTTVSEFWGGDIPWLSVVDFNNDLRKVYTTEKTITEEGLKNSSTRILKKGEIIISARGTVGVLAQLGRDMAFNQSCYGLRAKQNTTNDFVYYLLKQAVNKLKNSAHGSVFDTITRDTFNLIDVLFPPISEQQLITEILGVLDDKIALNRSMNSTLEAIGQALFRRWFVDFEFPDEEGRPYRSNGGQMMETELGEVPAGWRVDLITEVAEVVDCLHIKKPTQTEKGPILLQLYNIGEYGLLDFKELYHVSQEDYKVWTKNILIKEGDCILTNAGLAGAIAQIPYGYEVGLGRNITAVRPNKITSAYLIRYLFSEYGKKEIQKNLDVGTIFNSLNVKGIRKFKLLIPDKKIMDKFETLARPFRKTMEKNVYENLCLSEIRDALLPKLMSGEIRVSTNSNLNNENK